MLLTKCEMHCCPSHPAPREWAIFFGSLSLQNGHHGELTALALAVKKRGEDRGCMGLWHDVGFEK
jgi:hypothetical protein